jgi:ketosteroid isomerase-like protein
MSSAQAVLQLEDTGTVRKALRTLGGRATLGDIATRTGLSQARSEAALRALLEQHEGHLEVGERGDIVYRFDPSLIRRDAVPFMQRLKEQAWSIFKTGFKLWIVAMLVIYFLVFLALMIAALVAGNRDGDGGWEGGGGSDRRGGGVHFPNFWFWYLIWSPDWGWGRPYYGDRYGRTGGRRGRQKGPPFYKKVFAFVFGPDRPELSPERRDRDLLRFIRSRDGVVGSADLVQATGMSLEEADSELGRLMAAHDGEVEVTDDGTLVYTFPSLMVSAEERTVERRLPAAWQRLEPALPATGNSAGSNAAIVGINAFNMAAAATAPWFIFPRLGIGGTLAEIGLVWIPLIFSTAFFAVPLLRLPSVWKENARRAARNVRKAMLGLVTRSSLEGDTPGFVQLSEAEAVVKERLKSKQRRGAEVAPAMDRLVAEFDGEVEVSGTGEPRFSFPGFRTAIAAAHAVRERLGLKSRSVGEVVYDSGDSDAEADRRDLAAFDEALATGRALPGVDEGTTPAREPSAGETPAPEAAPAALPPANPLTEYLSDPDRFAVRDELELAAMEEEMRREAKRRYG